MGNTINFGIDLGTSNSLIARYERGNVEIFKNPNGLKETLPSAVGFRNDRILVGDQARAFAERDPKNVVTQFKRKMGTTETFKIKSLNTSKSPVELSSYVLKELKNFVHTGETIGSAVITIPASFDTVQCNATKEAGLLAGLANVVLLQEPIAASLAYANKEKGVDLRNSQWLVYDLGGGTFDVALVKIVDGELRVLDHEGDNYLGGSDIDALMVEKIVVPEVEKRGQFSNLLLEMKSESGRYNRVWQSLLQHTESAKIELSNRLSAEVDLGTVSDFRDDNDSLIDTIISISRSEFEALLKPVVDRTIEMMKRILTRNSIQPSDLQFILMVGGSTYIPYVRKRVSELMGIHVNTSIDPTNAVAVGAAYYAGTKEVAAANNSKAEGARARIRASYNKTSQDRDEVFNAKIECNVPGLHYRISSEDGAFDSGLKATSGRISENLPLREDAFNVFLLRISDEQGRSVAADLEAITIAQGRYSVVGQMLPDDISLVRDDISSNDTRLDELFRKNSILPLRAKRTVEVAKTVFKDAPDEVRIIVVEGPSDRHSSTNKLIGNLSIGGARLNRDLLRGTEIDLIFEMSESRDLTVSAYLNGTGQEFSQVFTPAQRHINSRTQAAEILELEARVIKELDNAEVRKGSNATGELGKILAGVEELIGETASISEDDVTDKKFQVDDKRRRLAQQLFEITSTQRGEQAKQSYLEIRNAAAELVASSGNDREKHLLQEILAREHIVLTSQRPEKIKAAAFELEQLQFQILLRLPEFLTGSFDYLVEKRTSMNDQLQSAQLIEGGKRAIQNNSWADLAQINKRLWDLMPAEQQRSEETKLHTGII